MKDYIKINTRPYHGIIPTKTGVNRTYKEQNSNFDQILNQKIQDKNLKISQHARQRMNMRNINLSHSQMGKLQNAVDKAEEKGVKESLILADDLAFIVSIKNRTIITVIDGSNIKENVFTNIDGAVIL